jgi:uncharacterized protein
VIARALALALLFAAGAASALVAIPRLSARVTDLTGTLGEGERSALEQKLAAFEREKGSQIAVLLVPTTEPETIEQFGIRLADAWKIGRGAEDDGAILIVAVDDRELRIEVGYGLEGAVPDAIANRIIEETIVPRFRAGDFAGGVDAGVDQLIRAIQGEPLPPPRQARGQGGDGFPSRDLLWLMVLAPLAAGSLVRSATNRFGGAATAGAVAGGLGWWFTGVAGAAIGLGLFCFLFILLAGAGPGRRGGWSSGGWGGGYSGGGGFGGGGWSGGGGGFGGGGASGRW